MPGADHFSERAGAYAAYRPSYPREFIGMLSSLAPSNHLAWDCGTGNGQAAVLLAEYFAEVVGSDSSSRQLSQAVGHPKVRYELASEGESHLDAASVDLVTAAQALHWFDLERFYAECHRVLRPRGVVAVWCYARSQIRSDVDAVVNWFHDTRLEPYWPPARRHVLNGYRELQFPFVEISIPPWTMSLAWTLDRFIRYVATWSATQAAQKAEGSGQALSEFVDRLACVWRPDERLVVQWPLITRAGHIV